MDRFTIGMTLIALILLSTGVGMLIWSGLHKSLPPRITPAGIIEKHIKINQPRLIIKVNGKTKVNMTDPFTKYAASLFTIYYAGQLQALPNVYTTTLPTEALLYSTQFSDLWNAINPGTANITLSSPSLNIIDNGTSLLANITFAGFSSIDVNITACALKTTFSNGAYITIATNLNVPLTLAVNDSIVIQWLITANYNGDSVLRTVFNKFINQIVPGVGTGIWNTGSTISGYHLTSPIIVISNGTSEVSASIRKFVSNVSIPNYAYIEGLGYFNDVPTNPQFLVLKAGSYSSGWVYNTVIFNETVTGLGSYRAVLLKIVVSFG